MQLVFCALVFWGFCYIVGHARISRSARERFENLGAHRRQVWICSVCDYVSNSGGGTCPEHGGFLVESTKTDTRPSIVFLLELIECPACLGFWVGLASGALWPSLVPFPVHRAVAALLLGMSTCGVNYLLGRLTGWIEE